MGLRSVFALVALLAVPALGLQGCSKAAQKIEPETRGKRGETCLARNDCASGLACLNGICAKNEFNIDVTAKQCTRIECEATVDCCGTKSTKAPAKCTGRDQICDLANSLIPGCIDTNSCTATSDTCGDGTCGLGSCSVNGQGGGSTCETTADCSPNTCETPVGATYGMCSLTLATCTATAPCAQPTCGNRRCDCRNPLYDETAPICTDPECDDICLLRCEDSLCIEDQSCKTNAECLALGLQVCDGGRCVECSKDSECDVDNKETCNAGLCHKPCKFNEECPLFSECKQGDCVYSGCHDDRECILAASRQTTGDGEAAVAGSADDPRLYKCLANDADAAHKTCKIPCENDGSCGQFQVCDAGYCKFVGCDSDEQCRNYLGIFNEMTSDAKPFVPQAKCVAPADLNK